MFFELVDHPGAPILVRVAEESFLEALQLLYRYISAFLYACYQLTWILREIRVRGRVFFQIEVVAPFAGVEEGERLELQECLENGCAVRTDNNVTRRDILLYPPASEYPPWADALHELGIVCQQPCLKGVSVGPKGQVQRDGRICEKRVHIREYLLRC